jgi:hypothetical protein
MTDSNDLEEIQEKSNEIEKLTLIILHSRLCTERHGPSKVVLITMTNPMVTNHMNYFQHYNDKSLDPLLGDYGPLMTAFKAPISREPTVRVTQFCKQVFATSEVQPHVYILLTQDACRAHTISLLHRRPYQHIAPIGSPVTKLDVVLMGDMWHATVYLGVLSGRWLLQPGHSASPHPQNP